MIMKMMRTRKQAGEEEEDEDANDNRHHHHHHHHDHHKEDDHDNHDDGYSDGMGRRSVTIQIASIMFSIEHGGGDCRDGGGDG